MAYIEERTRYQPGIGFSLVRLPIFIAGSLVTAVAVGWILAFVFLRGWYLLVLFAGLGAFAVGGVVYGLVGLAHCRNRWLAGFIGVVAGAVGYLSYYLFCMNDNLPWMAWQFDFLVDYIEFRLETDVVVDVGRGGAGGNPSTFMNWFVFGSEFLIMMGVPAAFAWTRASRAYSSELGTWMKNEHVFLPAHSGPDFRDALENGELDHFVRRTQHGGNIQSNARLILEYAHPPEGSALEHAIYATLEDFPEKKSWFRPTAFREKVIRQVELEPSEVLSLRTWFPNLTQTLEQKHEELRGMPPPLPLMEEGVVTEVAEITPVPEPYRQRVRSKGYTLAVNLRGLTPLIYFAGGAALAGLGIWFLIDEPRIPGAIMTVLGIPAFGWGAYTGLYSLGVYENRWIHRRLRKELGARTDVLVDSEDEDAIFVTIIPREAFAKVQWTMASDLLLLSIDEKRRRILMEGDADRYIIPAGAISVNETQCFFHPIDVHKANELWVVRLMIQTPEGPKELLVSVCHLDWSPSTNRKRRETARELCDRIDEMRDVP